MKLSKINLVYFSPTNTTRLVSSAVAKGVGLPVNHINITLPGSDSEYNLSQEDLVLFAAPVYSGRIPPTAVYRFNRFKGRETPAILLVVYGNRAYEDALLELKHLVQSQGFIPLAAGTFIGEHSFHSKKYSIAGGRPDKTDIYKAIEFGRNIRNKIFTYSLSDKGELSVPGNEPYRSRSRLRERSSPETIEDLCILCGLCSDVCPTSAINVNRRVITNKDDCIRCCACVKECLTGARVMTSSMLKIARWLHDNYRERKEPETFI